MVRKLVIIAYDIEDNKQRARMSKLLEGEGLRRIQKSVFSGWLTPSEASTIVKLASSQIGDLDRFFLVRNVTPSDCLAHSLGHPADHFEDWKDVILQESAA